MEREARKDAVSVAQREGAGEDILRRHGMRNIDDIDILIDRDDRGFDGRDKVVVRAEVGEQSNNRSFIRHIGSCSKKGRLQKSIESNGLSYHMLGWLKSGCLAILLSRLMFAAMHRRELTGRVTSVKFSLSLPFHGSIV